MNNDPKSSAIAAFELYLKDKAPTVFEKLKGAFKLNVVIGILEAYAKKLMNESSKNVIYNREPKSHLIFTEGMNYRYSVLDNFCDEFNSENADPVHEIKEYGDQLIGENIIIIHNNTIDVNCIFVLDGTTGNEFIYLCVYIG